VAEQLYNHTCQLLAMFALTLDDTPVTKNVLPQALHALPSPIKRKKDQGEKSRGINRSDFNYGWEVIENLQVMTKTTKRDTGSLSANMAPVNNVSAFWI